MASSPSRVVFVLTTSEGRDKLFKLVQYLLKSGIWLLQQRELMPESLWPQQRQLALRLSGNVDTVRNGRALFKVGWWITTLFEVRSLCVVAKAEWMAISGRDGADSSIMAAPPSHPSLEAADERKEGSARTTPAIGRAVTFVTPPSSPLKRSRMERWLRLVQVGLLLARSIASTARNVTRDINHLFMKKDFFGIRAAAAETLASREASRAAQQRINRVAWSCWVALAACDVTLNLIRLVWSWSAWVPNLERFECACMRVGYHDLSRLEFAPLDLVRGCPAASFAEKFLAAADPGEFTVTCTRCGQSRHPTSRQSDAVSCAADANDHHVDDDGSTTTVALVAPQDLPGGGGGGGGSELLDAAVDKVSSSAAAPPRRGVLFLPLLLRRLYRTWFTVLHHGNLRQTLLLQLRYVCELYMAMFYSYYGEAGDGTKAQERPVAAEDLALPPLGLLRVLEINNSKDDDAVLAQHRNISLILCGLVSATVSMQRVWIASGAIKGVA